MDGEIELSTEFITVRDGLQLSYRRYDWTPESTAARKGRKAAISDFVVVPDPYRTMDAIAPLIKHTLAASKSPATAITFDAIGNGDSDNGPRHVTMRADDLIDLCDALGLHKINAIAIGDGAQTVLATAPKRPTFLGSFIFIDGGPKYDAVGLARAAALSKKGAAPTEWRQAAEVTKAVAPGKFEALSHKDWTAVAETIWRKDGSKLKPMIDAPISDEREEDDVMFWRELAVLRRVPGLLIRGQTSPLMTEELAAEIAEKHGQMQLATIPGQGHTPYLRTAQDVEAIVEFMAV
jgi:pimeloyl-ACP methyl ester carboxylesterase